MLVSPLSALEVKRDADGALTNGSDLIARRRAEDKMVRLAAPHKCPRSAQGD